MIKSRKRNRVLGIILGGGKGERLYPLTRERSKPAVPFGGKYRIVDFVLSNFINSGLRSIYVLVQYRSQSLIEHLRLSWRAQGLTHDEFITVVPPQMKSGECWYRGTADAVAQNLNLIYDYNPDMVVVFGADHIYRMDINQMIDFHIANKADVTVAVLPFSRKSASGLGVVKSTRDHRVLGFREKPSAKEINSLAGPHIYVSLGNYIFSRDILIDVLRSIKKDKTDYDFGKHILPALFDKCRMLSYDLSHNAIPGLKSYEHKGYWRDVGTIESYWKAHMDLLGKKPALDLANQMWPVYSGRHDGVPSHISGGRITDSIFGGGCEVEGAFLKRCVLGRDVVIEKGAYLEDSIIMDGNIIGEKSVIKKSIIDRFNNIPPGSEIGGMKTSVKGVCRDSSGIAILPRGKRSVRV